MTDVTHRPEATRASGVGLMLGTAASNQLGAAVGALAFPVIGPVGVVAVRQWVAAAVMLGVTRPRLRSWGWRQWRLVLPLALVYGAMNLTLYSAVERIGLGLAVTLEFLGPLAVAVVSSRRRVDVACAAAAATGVVVLTRPQATTDYLGVALGLVAASCWAAYILLNRAIGAQVPGSQGPSVAGAVSALLFAPVGVAVLLVHRPTVTALLCAAAAGVLSSAVPFLVDVVTLRRVSAPVFGVFMSVNPVLAAAAGWLVLGQVLDLLAWAAIGVIVLANVVTVTSSGRTPAATGP